MTDVVANTYRLLMYRLLTLIWLLTRIRIARHRPRGSIIFTVFSCIFFYLSLMNSFILYFYWINCSSCHWSIPHVFVLPCFTSKSPFSYYIKYNPDKNVRKIFEICNGRNHFIKVPVYWAWNFNKHWLLYRKFSN